MNGYYQLTTLGEGMAGKFYKEITIEERDSLPAFRAMRKFSQGVADNINKDYPGSAIVENNLCYITNEYWQYCQDYVSANCETSSEYNMSRYSYNAEYNKRKSALIVQAKRSSR